jgi:diaminopimelate epimerase
LSKSNWPLPFSKYSGAGNDFIILDARNGETYNDPGALAKALCQRGRSVGADGLIVVEPDHGDTLARMRLWNADGSAAEISGNGARCVARFLVDTGADPENVHFDTDIGVVTAQVDGDICRLQLPTRARVFPSRRIRVEGRDLTGTYVEVGVPFFVCFHDNPDDLAVRFIGRAIRNHADLAPRGANVDFVRVEDDQRLYFRVYERGVEDETLSSGTGSISAALAAAVAGKITSPVVCRARGAELTVRFRRAAAATEAATEDPDSTPALAALSMASVAEAVAASESPTVAQAVAGEPPAHADQSTAGATAPDDSSAEASSPENTPPAPEEEASTDAVEIEPTRASDLPSLVEGAEDDCVEFIGLELEGDAMLIFKGEATAQASRGPRRK